MDGPSAYAYEPSFSVHEIERRRLAAAAADERGAAAESSGSDTDSDDGRPAPPNPPDRMENNEWCRCGNCQPLDSPLQCVCCHEVQNCEKFLPDAEDGTVHCVTEYEDFDAVCLHRAVLRTALIARLDCRGHVRRRLPEVLENESYRYAAYRMFTYWTHGLLGKGVRRVIPACVLKLIRQTFPAANGRYVGFRYVPDGEMLEVMEELAI